MRAMGEFPKTEALGATYEWQSFVENKLGIPHCGSADNQRPGFSNNLLRADDRK